MVTPSFFREGGRVLLPECGPASSFRGDWGVLWPGDVFLVSLKMEECEGQKVDILCYFRGDGGM